MAGLPEGTLTFMLTDLVGSTRAWESAPAAMREAMARHDRILDRRLKEHHSTEVPSGRAGDSSLAVFSSSAEAAACAVSLQLDFAPARLTAGINPVSRLALYTA